MSDPSTIPMTETSTKSYHLPWHQHDSYGIRLLSSQGHFPAALSTQLQQLGCAVESAGSLYLSAGKDWKAVWDRIYPLLSSANMLSQTEISVTYEDASGHGEVDRKPATAIQAISENVWLGEALLQGRIMCYLQPVVSARDKHFGYESFARVKATDGTVIAGNRIIDASKALGIEHMIDRHLHIEAIKTFVSGNVAGFLFINFIPGFIHRPAVYLEGLSDAARSLGIVSKYIVLEFTKSEVPRDIHHLRSVCEYARSRGYSIALDDIESVTSARKLVPEIRPDFVKIDMHLVREAMDPAKRDLIREITNLVHAAGGSVIAEGVETEEIYQQLQLLGVDLFQGYYFSPPMPVDAALQRRVGA